MRNSRLLRRHALHHYNSREKIDRQATQPQYQPWLPPKAYQKVLLVPYQRKAATRSRLPSSDLRLLQYLFLSTSQLELRLNLLTATTATPLHLYLGLAPPLPEGIFKTLVPLLYKEPLNHTYKI